MSSMLSEGVWLGVLIDTALLVPLVGVTLAGLGCLTVPGGVQGVGPLSSHWGGHPRAQHSAGNNCYFY